jgi:5-methylcytosine-specific restriction protein A
MGMGRLTNVKPIVTTLKPTLGRSTDSQGHSDTTEHWRKWYKLKRWCGTKAGGWLDGLRGHVLIRDGFICQYQGCGRLCSGKGDAIAHHIKAHRGDPDLFWDENNLQCVCKDCHDGPIQAEEAKRRASGLV